MNFVSADKTFKWMVVPGGGHSGESALAAEWFMEICGKTDPKKSEK